MLKVLPLLLSRIRQGDMLATLARGAGVAFAIQVMGTGLKYLLQVLLARWMGAAEYGAYAYAFTWANLLAVFAGLGLTTGVLRFIPQYLAKRDWARLHGLIRRSRQLVFGAGVMLAGLGSALLLLLQPQKVGLSTLLLGMWLVPLLALVNLQMELVRGTQRIALAYAPSMLLQPVLALGAAFFVLKAAGVLTGVATIGVLVLALLIVVGVQIWGLIRAVPWEAVSVPPRYDTFSWLRISLPLLLVSGSLIVLNQADILMIGILIGPKEAGIYTAATKTAALVSFVLVAVNAIAAPMISELHTKGDHEKLQQIVSTAAQWMFWPAFVAALGLVLFGGVILGLFGPEFSEGYWALVLLTLGQLINASVGPVGYLMGLTGHQDLSARVYGLSALVNIGLNAFMIPIWGLVGAAIATMVTMMLWNVWLYFLVRRCLGIQSFLFAGVEK